LLHRLIHPTEQVSCDYSIPHKVTEPDTERSILKLTYFFKLTLLDTTSSGDCKQSVTALQKRQIAYKITVTGMTVTFQVIT